MEKARGGCKEVRRGRERTENFLEEMAPDLVPEGGEAEWEQDSTGQAGRKGHKEVGKQ